MKNIKDFNDYISMMIADYDADHYGDYNTYAHWCADGSEYTIFYHSAWDLIELVKRYRSDLFYVGEEMAMNTFDPKHSSVDNLITSVAYYIIYTAMLNAFNQVHESDVEEGDES